jgi:lipopolysaccharide export system protein LptA
MAQWQRPARLVLATLAVAFATLVAMTLKERRPVRLEAPVVRSDPKAIVESAGGRSFRVNREHEEIRVEYDRLLTYPDGTSRMIGVKVVTERAGGRTFTITGKEGTTGQNEADVNLEGGVRISASDGMVVTADRAAFTQADGIARAPGSVRFSRGRMTGSGVGFTYDRIGNVLTIGERAEVQVAPDEHGEGGVDIRSGTLTFVRNDRTLRFDHGVKASRGGETIEADAAVGRMTEAEDGLEGLVLHGNARITPEGGRPGTLRSLSGQAVDLTYAPDGQTLRRAVVTGGAVIEVDGGGAGRQVAAHVIDVSLAEDGKTPVSLDARDNVRFTLAAEHGGVVRTVAAQTLAGRGDRNDGLRSARFDGNVQFSEQGQALSRAARSMTLDMEIAPGFSSIKEARFTRSVRFSDGDVFATAPEARYVLETGVLELTGADAGSPTSRVVNSRIRIDALRLDVKLEGPLVKAAGAVKSELRPPPEQEADGEPRPGHRVPSLLKQDQPVNVTSQVLAYDGAASQAVYSGGAQLWQSDTSIKASSITIDGSTGNLKAAGSVTTSTTLVQTGQDGTKDRVRSIASATQFQYEEAARRAVYSGDAHVTGPQGDLTAKVVELYLKPSGEELERAEAYEAVTLKAGARTTTGLRLTYFSADDRYLVTGAPVTIVDDCGRETVGRTLTYLKAADRIVIDGSEQVRTQTKSRSSCP